ncbi:hypothetical protein GCM10009771_16770 [Nesterenkonia flava]
MVWELWWTGIDADRDRREATEEFFSNIQATGPDGPSAAGSDGEPSFEVCYTLDDGTEIGCSPSMRDLADGEATMAMLYAPRLGDDWAAPVRHGTESTQLDRGGVGHYTGTQWPDERGNFALAGHRNTYASMLGNQDRLTPGDHLYLQTAEGIYTYEVSESYVVLPHERDVIAPVPRELEAEPETGLLTLTTCHPLFSNAERLITHARIVDFQPTGTDVPAAIAHHMPDDAAAPQASVAEAHITAHGLGPLAETAGGQR